MTRYTIIPVLLLAVAIRLGAGVWWQQRLPENARFHFPDSESYWRLAAAVAQGEPYQLGPDRQVFRTPGYPVVLALLFWATRGEPPVLAARALNAVLGTAAVAGVMWLTFLLFDARAAMLAGLGASVYPGAIAMSVFVLSEAPFCPLMILHLVLWVLAWREPRQRRQMLLAILGGVAAGFATLMRPSWLLFTPFALVSGVAIQRPRLRQLRLGAVMLLALGLTMSPWWVRNGRVTGDFVPTTLQVGESLYDGLHAGATGASDMRFVDEFRRELRAEDRANGEAAGRPCFELRLDRRMRDAAFAWVRENPGESLRLAGVKFLRLWNFVPNEPSFRSMSFRIAVFLGYTPILAFGLCGAVRFGRRGWPYVLCILPAVYFSCLHMIFVGSLRYRQPAVLVMIVLAAGFAGWCIERYGKRMEA